VHSQAVIQANLDNGSDIYGICSSQTPYTLPAALCVRDIFSPYLNATKSCDSTQGSSCISNNNINSLDNSGINLPSPIGILYTNDGALLRFWMNSPSQSFSILVDANGQKPPNTFGKDVYYFTYINKQLFPNQVGNIGQIPACDTQGLNCAGYYLTH
jgi:hypothetical protein